MDNIYIKVRRSRDCFLSSSLEFCTSGSFSSFSNYAKHIVNKMKVYIERNNLQLELIRYL